MTDAEQIKLLTAECVRATAIAWSQARMAEAYRCEAERWQRLALIAYDVATQDGLE